MVQEKGSRGLSQRLRKLRAGRSKYSTRRLASMRGLSAARRAMPTSSATALFSLFVRQLSSLFGPVITRAAALPPVANPPDAPLLRVPPRIQPRQLLDQPQHLVGAVAAAFEQPATIDGWRGACQTG